MMVVMKGQTAARPKGRADWCTPPRPRCPPLPPLPSALTLFSWFQAYKANTGGKTIKRGKERDVMKRKSITFKKNRTWTSRNDEQY